MKTKYIYFVLFGFLSLLAGCTAEEDVTLLDDIQVNISYVALPVDGGSATIKVTSTKDWTAEKVVTKKDSAKWLGISAAQGNAGETELTFSAPKTLDGRSATVLLHCGDETQRINILQGLPVVPDATCADIIAGPNDKTYRVTGKVASIYNTTYGNWFLTDKTGTIEIYGTLDKDGNQKNFLSLGIEAGDEVTVQGPKKTYNTKVELVDVTVVKITKSLIKVDSVKNAELPLEGGEATAYLTCKGQGVSVDIPAEAKSWLSISSINSQGKNSVLVFKAMENKGGDRQATITFRTTDGKKEYSSQTKIMQSGAIVDATIAEFNAFPKGETQYRVAGVINKIADAAKGNFYIRDFSGETYVYNLAGFAATKAKEGDIVTVVGKRDQYKDVIELTSGKIEKQIPVTAISVAEFLKKPNSKDVYYMVTGTIDEIQNPVYGNLYINDGKNNRVLVYGCYSGWGAIGDDRKGFLEKAGIKVGDKLTMIGYKDTYNDKIELCGGVYYRHESK